MHILDPTDESVPVRKRLAARPPRVTGPLGLLDISKPRGDAFLKRLETRLAGQFPELQFQRYRKPTYTKPAPEALRTRIISECAMVVVALAD